MHLIGNFEFGGKNAPSSEQKQILNTVFPTQQEFWFLVSFSLHIITQLCLFK